MATLAAAWRNSGGTVLGLAPTAAAAEVLGAELDAHTDTIAKLVQLQSSEHRTDDPARKWFDAIDSDALLIVDEAGMASRVRPVRDCNPNSRSTSNCSHRLALFSAARRVLGWVSELQKPTNSSRSTMSGGSSW